MRLPMKQPMMAMKPQKLNSVGGGDDILSLQVWYNISQADTGRQRNPSREFHQSGDSGSLQRQLLPNSFLLLRAPPLTIVWPSPPPLTWQSDILSTQVYSPRYCQITNWNVLVFVFIFNSWVLLWLTGLSLSRISQLFHPQSDRLLERNISFKNWCGQTGDQRTQHCLVM